MTTNELKSYIDRIIGNSLRCILPSYWWKKLFGVVVEYIEKIEKTLSSKDADISKVKDFATQKYIYIPIPPEVLLDAAYQQLHNQTVYRFLLNIKFGGFLVYPDNTMIYLRMESTIMEEPPIVKSSYAAIAVLAIYPRPSSNTYVFDLYTEDAIYTLYPEGYVAKKDRPSLNLLLEKLDDLESEITDCVTETEMNRAIAEALTNTLNTEV